MNDWLPDRSKFKTEGGTYLTQSLFLEVGYDVEKAIYTFSDEDKTYKGQMFKSLRKFYLEMEDPTEYFFATKYLHGWEHWQRIVENQLLKKHVDEWRDELEVRLRAKGVKQILGMGVKNFTAAKWAADGHWHVKRARPTKQERDKERVMRERALNTVNDDASRVAHLITRSPKDE